MFYYSTTSAEEKPKLCLLAALSFVVELTALGINLVMSQRAPEPLLGAANRVTNTGVCVFLPVRLLHSCFVFVSHKQVEHTTNQFLLQAKTQS